MSRNTDDLLDAVLRIRDLVDSVSKECAEINERTRIYISEKPAAMDRILLYGAIHGLKDKLETWGEVVKQYGIEKMLPVCWEQMEKSFNALKENERALRGNKKARRLNQALHNPPE